jgi:hypothetical protein
LYYCIWPAVFFMRSIPKRMPGFRAPVTLEVK